MSIGKMRCNESRKQSQGLLLDTSLFQYKFAYVLYNLDCNYYEYSVKQTA